MTICRRCGEMYDPWNESQPCCGACGFWPNQNGDDVFDSAWRQIERLQTGILSKKIERPSTSTCISVLSLYPYLSSNVWREVSGSEKLLARKGMEFVKILKGDYDSGSFFSGGADVLDTFKHELVTLIEIGMHKQIQALEDFPLKLLVPIPGSKRQNVGESCLSLTISMELLKSETFISNGFVLCDIFSFKEQHSSARSGNKQARDVTYLADNLKVLKVHPLIQLIKDKKVAIVLIDDVLTTGAHMKACFRKLEECDVDLNRVFAWTTAKTVHKREEIKEWSCSEVFINPTIQTTIYSGEHDLPF